MKKLFFSFVVFIGLFITTQAQVKPRSLFIQASLTGNNSRWPMQDEFTLYHGTVGHGADMSIIYGLSKHVSFQGGIGIKALNFKTRRVVLPFATNASLGVINTFTYTNNLTYFQIPLFLNFVLGSHKMHFLFSPGIESSFLFKANEKEYMDAPAYTQRLGTLVKKRDIKDRFSAFNIFVNAGIGGLYDFNEFFSMSAKIDYGKAVMKDADGHFVYYGLRIGGAYRLHSYNNHGLFNLKKTHKKQTLFRIK